MANRTENIGNIKDITSQWFYTEDETNSLVSTKSDIDHTHDDRYYTESEIDSKLVNKANSVHTHNDVYYTESEIDVKIESLKSSINSEFETNFVKELNNIFEQMLNEE